MPKLDDAHTQLSKRKCKEALDQAVEYFEKEIEEVLDIPSTFATLNMELALII